MSKRHEIDWEAIERDFRIGQLSIREIARRYEVQPSSITRKAEKERWSRDFSNEVKARTRAALIETAQHSAQQKATESNAALLTGIEVAVQTNIKVLEEHSASIQSNADRLKRLTAKFDELIDGIDDLGGVVKAAGSFESMVRSQKTLVGLQRQVLNIDDNSDKNQSLGEFLEGMQ